MNKISQTLFLTLCLSFITICVLVHVWLLFWVFYNTWKITFQRSLTVQEENKDNDFESQDMSTNEINNMDGSLSDSKELEIVVNNTIVVYKNHAIVVYKLDSSTTEVFPCHQLI